ncbi:MAG: hypothetical protein ACI841_000318 [Planctomycetota bacterium]|jgi:hypothetical protein
MPHLHAGLQCATNLSSAYDLLGSKLRRSSFGLGLSDELKAKLLQADSTKRRSAIEELVKTYVGRRLDLLRLTGEERIVWTQELGKMKKIGMSRLGSYQNSGGVLDYEDFEGCPLCDGAFDAAEDRASER